MSTTTVTAESIAARLNGREIGEEVNPVDEALAKLHGFVIVFGYSDDNVEFRGAIHDEVGCYNGGKFRVDDEGVQPTWDDAREEKDRGAAEEYFRRRSKKSVELHAQWRDVGNPCWAYEMGLPYATFDIMEDGEVFCRGIVFSALHLK